MVGFDVQAESNSESALDETTHEHEVLLARYTPTAVYYIADEATKRTSPDVQQTINSSDLRKKHKFAPTMNAENKPYVASFKLTKRRRLVKAVKHIDEVCIYCKLKPES